MNDLLFLSIEELKALFLKHFRLLVIVASALFGGVAVALLFSPSYYHVQASYKYTPLKSQSLPLDIKNLIHKAGLSGGAAAPASVMQSDRLLSAVVERLGLQVVVKQSTWLGGVFEKIGATLLAEIRCALWQKDPFLFQDVCYLAERPLHLLLVFSDESHFELRDRKERVLVQGVIGEKVQFVSMGFTLLQVPRSLKFNHKYPLTLLPRKKVVQQIGEKLIVKSSKMDQEVLRLTYRDTDRHRGAFVLNELMSSYDRYLKNEYTEIASVQIEEIEKREATLKQVWQGLTQELVGYFQENVEKSGAFCWEQGLLAALPLQEAYEEELSDKDLKSRRLQEVSKVPLGAKREQLKCYEKLSELEIAQAKVQLAGFHVLSPFRTKITPALAELELLDLETAQSAYEESGLEWEKVHSLKEQLLSVSRQLTSNDFEMTSLSTMLTDPVSMELLQAAGRLSMALHDENNRNPKEQERLKEALVHQKRFLKTHLEHAVSLQEIRERLLSDKRGALEQLVLRLIVKEKRMLETKLAELKAELVLLPKKWRRENALKLSAHTVEGLLTKLCQLKEAKKLDRELFQVESRMLDAASAPLYAKPKYLLMKASSAGLCGAFFVYLFYFCAGLFRGFPLTAAHLRFRGLRVCGFLRQAPTALGETDERTLETLRTIAALCDAQRVLVFIGAPLSLFAPLFVELMRLQGKKGMVLDCFLQTRYAVEELRSARYQQLVEDLKNTYDYVVLATSALPESHEAQALLEYAEAVFVQIVEEKVEEIVCYEGWQKKRREGVLSFII